MSDPRRIYLDNAATSWPKPPRVYEAVDRYLRENGAPAGRSAYREAAEVERRLRETRQAVADLLEVGDSRQVVFTCNGTDSLNLALHGLLDDGDHVVTSVVEHNSVLRPLEFLESNGRIEVSRVSCDRDGVIEAQRIREAVRPDTRLIALTHASNVTGAVQPVEQVGRIAAEHGVTFLVDAAQTLGHLPVTPRKWGAQLVAAPGHKGLLAPLGVGILYVEQGLEADMRSTRQGGTGTRSEVDRQPSDMPDKFESGNHAVPAIIGLGEGIRYLRETGIEELAERARSLTARLIEGLGGLPRVSIRGPSASADRIAVVSLSIQGYDPQEVCAMLDASWRIQARAGIHCAPRMHQALGTIESGGTVRFSLGPFNTKEDIDEVIGAIGDIASS